MFSVPSTFENTYYDIGTRFVKGICLFEKGEANFTTPFQRVNGHLISVRLWNFKDGGS